MSAYLSNGIEHVTVGGETSRDARVCNLDWVLKIREQCVQNNVTFWFKNTGSQFLRNGVIEKINPFKQSGVAKELNIDILNGKKLF